MNSEDSYTFVCKTKLYIGADKSKDIGKILSLDYLFKRVLLVYGGSSAKKSGLYDAIINSLDENKIVHQEYSGITANPDIEDVIKIVSLAREFKPEILIALGGGSVMDACKSAAVGYYYDGNPLDFNKHIVEPINALPVCCIPTISASGSEMSNSCVISDRKHNFKSGFNSELNYPLFSIIDPKVTLTVPRYQLGIGFADMLSHSFERYFYPSKEYELADGLALSVMREIVEVSKRVFEDEKDLVARRDMMLAAAFSHNGITGVGKNKNFVVHKAEHKLSALYPALAHGQGIALLLVDFLKINEEALSDKIIRFGREVFKVDGVVESINALKEWLDFLPIYHSFKQLPFTIDQKDIDKVLHWLNLSNK